VIAGYKDGTELAQFTMKLTRYINMDKKERYYNKEIETINFLKT